MIAVVVVVVLVVVVVAVVAVVSTNVPGGQMEQEVKCNRNFLAFMLYTNSFGFFHQIRTRQRDCPSASSI